jgi:peptide/nickel transport system permease protein
MGLARYALRRTLLVLVTLFGVSVITFGVTNILPGSVAALILGTRANPERIAALEQQLGLNEPLYLRYIDWITGVLRGNLGQSIRFDEPIAGLLAQRLPASIFLAGTALTIAILIAIPLGVAAAIDSDGQKDLAASLTAFIGISLPNFFWGIVLILVFAKYLPVLPPAGYTNPLVDPIQGFSHVLLPALALGFSLMAHLTRMTRSSLMEELRSEYIRLARSKGISEGRIVYVHALRNAFLPVLTVIGFQLGYLFGGIIVIEQVFSYPGLGSITFQALLNRDVPLIQATVLVIATIFMLSNLVVDLLYAVIDPRIQTGGGS